VTLREHARDFAEVILANARREYPNDMHHRTTGPDDRPLPRELHPSFYGCFDWHSAVEMHWALVRLLRRVPDSIPVPEARALLDEHLAAEPLAVEAAYIADHPLFERPYVGLGSDARQRGGNVGRSESGSVVCESSSARRHPLGALPRVAG
jgi:hypothetical protein